jgi:hypothetical protein
MSIEYRKIIEVLTMRRIIYHRLGCKSVLICLTIQENNRSYKALARASRQSLA